MGQPQRKMEARPEKDQPLYKGLQAIKTEIEKILQRMQKDTNYTPERSDLDQFSARAVELIQKYHPKIATNQKTLLAAVIDLTEVPVMHPKMQRVAFQTALKDASANLDSYLANY